MDREPPSVCRGNRKEFYKATHTHTHTYAHVVETHTHTHARIHTNMYAFTLNAWEAHKTSCEYTHTQTHIPSGGSTVATGRDRVRSTQFKQHAQQTHKARGDCTPPTFSTNTTHTHTNQHAHTNKARGECTPPTFAKNNTHTYTYTNQHTHTYEATRTHKQG